MWLAGHPHDDDASWGRRAAIWLLVTLGCAIADVWILYRLGVAVKYRPKHVCKCGYDLRGALGSICPACGRG